MAHKVLTSDDYPSGMDLSDLEQFISDVNDEVIRGNPRVKAVVDHDGDITRMYIRLD